MIVFSILSCWVVKFEQYVFQSLYEFWLVPFAIQPQIGEVFSQVSHFHILHFCNINICHFLCLFFKSSFPFFSFSFSLPFSFSFSFFSLFFFHYFRADCLFLLCAFFQLHPNIEKKKFKKKKKKKKNEERKKRKKKDSNLK